MGKQRRMRKIAKNIASMPKYKKMMAEFLASNHGPVDTHKMLVEGHRGYLAWDETKLSKEFDKKYDELVKKLEEIEKIDKSYRHESSIKLAKSQVDKAEKIYDEIFEQVFL